MMVAMSTRVLLLASLVLAACGGGDDDGGGETWEIVHQDLDRNFLSVWGTAADDVWAVGARGHVQHWDGASWEVLDPGTDATLWWIHGFAGGPIYLGGSGGTIVRYDGGAFTTMTTPAATPTVFGIWGASPDQVWAVGGNEGGGGGGFIWTVDGDAWVEAPGVPAAVADKVVWKAQGRAADDAWMVGTDGLLVRWDGSALALDDTGLGESLFTVASDGERFVAVGGLAAPLMVENRGDGWVEIDAPQEAFGLKGVALSDTCDDLAVGDYGYVLRDRGDGFDFEDTGFATLEGLHAVWLDPGCGVWAVGGRQTNPYDGGVMVHYGAPLAAP